MLNRHASLPRLLLLLLLLVPGAGRPAQAQDSPGADPLEADLTAEALQARLSTLQASSELAAELKQQAEAALQAALDDLAQTEQITASAEAFAREAAAAPALLATIREELARPVEAPEVTLPEEATLALVEPLVLRAEQELAAAQERFEQLRREQDRRGERRVALEQQITATRASQRQLEEALEAPAETGPLGEALRLRLLAQRELARRTLQADESELANYEARRELLPARLDRADRRVLVSQRALTAWREVAAEFRRGQADAATRETERLRLEAARQSAEMLALANENQRLAVLRSGTLEAPGTTAQLNAAQRALQDVRDQLTAVRERSTTVRAKVEAAGLTNSMGLLLRKELEALPATALLRERMRLRQDAISDLQYQLIVRSEQRSRAGDIERWLTELLADAAPRADDERADLERVGRELLTQRRDLLTALLEDYEKLFARLIELDTASRQTIEASEDFRDYIEERILWVRSVSGQVTPDLGDAADALRWLVAGASWSQGLAATWVEVQRRWLAVLFGTLAILGVLFSRFWSRGRIKRMADIVERDPRDSFRYTGWGFLIVLVRATAFPALLGGVGWALAIPARQPAVVLAAASGLDAAAIALFAYELLRQVIHVQGLGEVHFRWPREVCAYLRRHLAWYIPVNVATVFLVTTFDQQRESDLWNDSLGRSCFVLGMIALGAFNQRTLRPSGPVFADHLRAHPQGWLCRLRLLWYPLAVGLPVGLAAAALVGYYYTALRLEERLHAWIWLLLGLVLANALFFRWLRAAKRQLQRAAVATPPPEAPRDETPPEETAPPAPAPETPPATPTPDAAALDPGELEPESLPEDPAPPAIPQPTPLELESAAAARTLALVGVELAQAGEGRLALPTIDAQTRRLFRSAMALVLILGTYVIWASVLPALKRLEQVQIYPELALIDTESPATPTDAAEAPPGGAVVQSEQPIRVTLADLGLALIILVFTGVAAQNLPGLLEILVLQRLPLDAGARYAAITLARYVIVLVGGPIGLAQVGITWDRVQWLAAALTFGLAFGLQEIFANFVSGLIILFERPVRVGDVVTVLDTSGVVTRIRMRATTITDFDRKELIVPNKQFVTGAVVNWVLSDAVVRVVIPVGLGYGEDVDAAREIVVEIARAHPLVLSAPAPSCQVCNLGPSTFDLELWVYVASAQDMSVVRTDLIRDLHKKLTAAGVDLPYPQQDVHIRSAPPTRSDPDQEAR